MFACVEGDDFASRRLTSLQQGFGAVLQTRFERDFSVHVALTANSLIRTPRRLCPHTVQSIQYRLLIR